MQQKLRPFDLLEALRGKPIIDEDGSIGHYKFSSENALQGIFHLFHFVQVGHVKNEYVISYIEPAEEFENCHWVPGVCGKPINRVIKMAPEKKIVWVPLIKNKRGEIISCHSETYDSQEAATDAVEIFSEDFVFLGAFPITVEI